MSDYLTKLKNKKQVTGELPLLSKGKNLAKEPNNGTAFTVKRAFGSKDSTPVGHFFEIKMPPPDLFKIQPEDISEYTDLWYRAWELADFVDGNTAPYEDRIKKLPELNEMVEHMRIIENRFKPAPARTGRLKKIPGLVEDLFQAPAVWIREEKKTWTPDVCPARCRTSGKCYGIAYFDHKPGKALDCQQDQCPWME